LLLFFNGFVQGLIPLSRMAFSVIGKVPGL
jgi:hypothetical protein